MSKGMLDKCIDLIGATAGDAPAEIALILGSGLASLADEVDGVRIAYSDLPGFGHASVSGHVSELVIGTLYGLRVAVMSGREHYYEKGRPDAMRHPLAVMKALGAKVLLVTNASGSLREDIRPGDLMIVSDHINYSGMNPLIGEPTDARFVNMTDAYDPDLRAAIEAAGQVAGVPLKSGVYAWFSGPSFETPAEIRMLQALGADAVGMSTVPEIILGRFFGLRCAAVSMATNMGAGLSDEHLTHEHTKSIAPIGAEKLRKVIAQLLPTFAQTLSM